MARNVRSAIVFGCALPLAVVVLAIAAISVFALVQRESDKDNPAAAAPVDLCAIIGADRLEAAVPYGERKSEASYSTTTAANGDAACVYSTRDKTPANATSYGALNARILRHGQVSGLSGVDRAKETLTSACESLNSTSGIGDESCVNEDQPDSGGTAGAQLVVLRGADVFWVRYYVNPGADANPRRVVTEIAQQMIANI